MPARLMSAQQIAEHGHLFQLYDQMLGEVEISRVLKQTSEVVLQLFNAERATIYMVLPDTQELKAAAIIGNVSRTIRIPIREDSLAGYCACSRRSFVIEDAYGDLSKIDPNLRFNRTWDDLDGFRTRDVMCAPAIFHNETLGVVQIINSRGKPFQQSDLAALDNASRFVAYALYHARLYDELATLKCLEKEKAEFMRIVVHELRAPVAASRTLVSALQFAHKDNPEISGVLSRIEGRMDQLLTLVEDILHLSRIKAGRPLGEITECNLTSETATTFGNYQPVGQGKGLAMDLQMPDEPVKVRIDKKGYQLILSNLISNAVKYCPTGNVDVTLRQKNKWAEIEVRDTGMGIPEADIPHLFTEFYRATNARNSNIAGTGVGLAGVKQLVERFGGELTLDSHEGEGSAFTVRLPLYEG